MPADKKISELDAGSALTGAELIPVVQSSSTVRSTISAILTYIQAQALNLAANFAIATNKFTVNATSGNTAVAGTLGVTGDVAVNTNKFTVAASTGNTVVAGTLGVTSDVAVNTNKFTVAGSTGNTAVAGTLTVNETATFNKTAQASTAETIATFKVSDDSTAKIDIVNDTASDAAGVLAIKSTGASSFRALGLYGLATADTGTNPVWHLDARTAGGAAITTRPLGEFRNNGTALLQFLPLNSGAGLAASWGTQAVSAPTFTTRSNGTRLVLYSAVGASDVDYAIGMGGSGPWFSTARPTSSYDFKWYGGTTNIASLQGDGVFWVGTNPTVTSGRGIGTQKTFTDTANAYAAVEGQALGNPSGASTGNVIGVIGQGGTSSANAQNYTGTVGLIGVQGTAVHRGTGTVTGAANFYAGGFGNSGGGTITNTYGLYIPTNAVGTNAYAIFTGANTSVFGGDIRIGSSTGPIVSSGSGSPEGVKTAPVGSTYHRTDGGAGTSFYVKESGTGNTGWVAK